jgi:hypothetical protein
MAMGGFYPGGVSSLIPFFSSKPVLGWAFQYSQGYLFPQPMSMAYVQPWIQSLGLKAREAIEAS